MSKLLHGCIRYCTFVQESEQMEDQLVLRLDEGLDMVVTFLVQAGEEATDISPSYPTTLSILRVVLWQKDYQQYNCVDITCADDNLLDWNVERIEQEVWKHLQNQ